MLYSASKYHRGTSLATAPLDGWQVRCNSGRENKQREKTHAHGRLCPLTGFDRHSHVREAVDGQHSRGRQLRSISAERRHHQPRAVAESQQVGDDQRLKVFGFPGRG